MNDTKIRRAMHGLMLMLGLLAGMPAMTQDGAPPVAAWQQPTAPAGAPNIIVVLIDDVGFGAASTFGGPVATPVFDQLAAEGLRYNRFHTTAVCSPTRAALLSGRNHHRVEFGDVSGGEKPQAGYTGIWPRSAATVARVLKDNGYSTGVFGKWHNTPNWEATPVGPFDRWPSGLGFEYFYGFMGGEADQWQPVLYRNNVPVLPAESGYNLNEAIADEAISWIHTHQALVPDKPYFLFFTPGATHAPHQVGAEWIEKYRGRFDAGWDEMRRLTFARQKKLGVIPRDARLSERPVELPAWDDMSPDARRLYARQMEVFAAFLEQTDHEIGRVLDAARNGPGGGNTLVVYIMGDNGSSAEGGLDGSDRNLFEMITGKSQPLGQQLARMDELGGPKADNHFASAWAWATDTPFQWTKQIASHLGGTRNPLVISWPGHVNKGGQVRDTWTHVIDIAPTLYEIVGVEPPQAVDGVEQTSIDGVSFAATLRGATPEVSRTQYFNTFDNRAIYSDGWMASARHHVPWRLHEEGRPLDGDRWELYDLRKDFSQAVDLADRHPDKLVELQALYEREAQRNGAVPLSAMTLSATLMNIQPSLSRGRQVFVFRGDVMPMPSYGVPMLFGSHRIDARIVVPEGGADGVIVANGARDGGFVLYVQDGHLVYENNFANLRYDTIRSATPLPEGGLMVSVIIDGEPGKLGGQLLVDGKEAGTAPIPGIFMPSYLGAFCVGRSCATPVGQGYAGRFPFAGEVGEVRITR